MGGVAKGIKNAIQGNKRLKEAKKKEQEAKEELDKQKALYQNLDTSNPFEGMVSLWW